MKKIWLWYLYDFANSFASIVVIFYYPLILSEKGVSNAWIGFSASISTVILLLTLPYLGTSSDKTSRRIYFIRVASVLMVFSLIVIAFMTQKREIFDLPFLLILSGFYILFFVCFQGSYVFYSAILRSITSVENSVKVSGIGLGLGQLGNAIALGLIGPIIGSSLIIYGLQGKPLALLIGGFIFILFSLPFLLQKELKVNSTKIGFSYKGFIKKIYAEKRIFYFLVGYSFLSDAILTFQLYITIYIKKVFSFSDQLVTYAGITGLVFGIVGGFLAYTLAKKLKNKERALGFSSVLYAFCFAACALIPSVPIFVFFGLAISGLSYGLVFSLARTIYSEITPEDKQGEFFSIFTVFERAASVVGPLVWLLTFFLLKSFGENIQYRGSVLLLVLVCFCGVYFLNKSKKIILK